MTTVAQLMQDIEEFQEEDRQGPVYRFGHLRAKRQIEAAAVERDLAQFIEEHAVLAGNRPGTAEYNRDRAQVLVRFAREFGLARVEDFTEEHGLAFAAWLASQRTRKGPRRGQPWGPRSQNMAIKFAKMAFAHLVRQGRVAVNPFQQIKDRREDRSAKPCYLSDQDIELLAAGCDLGRGTGCRDFLLLMFGVSVGPRPSELVKLRLCDLDGNRLTIRAEASKTHSTRELYLPEDPKRRGRLDRRIGGVLADYLLWRKATFPSLTDSDALFVGRMGQPLRVNGLAQVMTRMALAAGLPPERVFPYAMRHTAAVRAMKASNGDLDFVARMLGHTSLDMTRRYLRWLGEDVRERSRQVTTLAGLRLPTERPERKASLRDLKEQAKREGLSGGDLRSLLLRE
jgi:integrase